MTSSLYKKSRETIILGNFKHHKYFLAYSFRKMFYFGQKFTWLNPYTANIFFILSTLFWKPTLFNGQKGWPCLYIYCLPAVNFAKKYWQSMPCIAENWCFLTNKQYFLTHHLLEICPWAFTWDSFRSLQITWCHSKNM